MSKEKRHNNIRKYFSCDSGNDSALEKKSSFKDIISATNLVFIAISIFGIFLLLFQLEVPDASRFLAVHFKKILFSLSICYLLSILWQFRCIEKHKIIIYIIQSVLLVALALFIPKDFEHNKYHFFWYFFGIALYTWVLMSNWASLSTSSLTPSQLISFSFIFAIISGALTLYLPISIKEGSISFIDSIFMATSAVCVTGLSLFDISETFSLFGLIVLLILIQIGGIGIMTFSVLFMSMISQKVSVNDRVRNYSVFDLGLEYKPLVVVRVIMITTFVIEAIGAVILFMHINIGTLEERIFNSIFHSISAFCNAGFSTYGGLYSFADDYSFVLTICALIIFGGLGFTVIFHLLLMLRQKVRANIFKTKCKKIRMTTQTRVVLTMTILLLVFGTLFLLFNENSHSFKDYSFDKKLVVSFFNSVSPRTAGFEIVPISEFNESSQWFVIFLMFIGASPGSTAGGIKTTTFFLLLCSLYIVVKNKTYATVAGRRIQNFLISKSIAVAIISLSIAIVSSYLVSLFNPEKDLFAIIYECTSAISTVGLSLGGTDSFSDPSKAIIILLMYIGRIGHLTIFMSLGHPDSERTRLLDLPSEDIMIG